jgi:hypothetical protein
MLNKMLSSLQYTIFVILLIFNVLDSKKLSVATSKFKRAINKDDTTQIVFCEFTAIYSTLLLGN